METTIFWLDAVGKAVSNETKMIALAILKKNFFLRTDDNEI